MEEFDKVDAYVNEFAKATRDLVISKVPVAGPAVVRFLEAIEKANLQIKINFLEEFISELKGVDKNEINWDHLDSVEFLVMFNSVLERIRYTTAEEKKKRFKEILIKDLKTTYKSDFKETFLDLILRLNEDQIRILQAFNTLKAPLNAEVFQMDEDLYRFYLQDLTSKALLHDDAMSFAKRRPVIYTYLTPFGREFLKFLE
jgi:hypothetical protein